MIYIYMIYMTIYDIYIYHIYIYIYHIYIYIYIIYIYIYHTVDGLEKYAPPKGWLRAQENRGKPKNISWAMHSRARKRRLLPMGSTDQVCQPNHGLPKGGCFFTTFAIRSLASHCWNSSYPHSQVHPKSWESVGFLERNNSTSGVEVVAFP